MGKKGRIGKMEILAKLENEIMECICVITPADRMVSLRRLLKISKQQSNKEYHKRRKTALLEKYIERGYAFDPPNLF